MKKEIKGLILFDQDIGEKDRAVTVLTSSMGVIRCFTKGAQKFTNPNFSHTQAMNYCRLNVYFGRNSNTIDEADIIRTFYDIRNDIFRFAAAQYLCEIVSKIVPEGTQSEDQLELMLNCLHLLSKGEKPYDIIKAVCEIRLCVCSGIPPRLIYCGGCGKYEDEPMFFDPNKNILYCSSCAKKAQTGLRLNKGALTAFRYIALSEPKKAFSFSLPEDSMRLLSDCAEQYVISAFNVRPRMLDYYKQLLMLPQDGKDIKSPSV